MHIIPYIKTDIFVATARSSEFHNFRPSGIFVNLYEMELLSTEQPFPKNEKR